MIGGQQQLEATGGMEATGGKQPLTARRGKRNGYADGGSCGIAVQCLNSPSRFFGVRRNLRGRTPRFVAPMQLRARVSGQNPSRIVRDNPGGLEQSRINMVCYPGTPTDPGRECTPALCWCWCLIASMSKAQLQKLSSLLCKLCDKQSAR
jgi:hypothetical protein